MQQQHLALLQERRLINIDPDSCVQREPLSWVDVAGIKPRISSPNPTIMGKRETTVIRIPRGGNLRAHNFSRCAINKCYCSCHESTSISGRFWSLRLPLPSYLMRSCNRSSCSNYKRASLWISLRQIGIPYAVIASLDMMWNSQNTFISPSLQIRRVVSWNAPAFMAVRDVRWLQIEWQEAREKLVGLFRSGQVSPLDVLPDGMTLVEVSSPNPNFYTICHFIH